MIISNSDIGTFQTCQKKFFFAKTLGLQSAVLDEPLRMGLRGHKMLQKALENPADPMEAMQKVALQAVQEQDPESARILRNDWAVYEWMKEQGYEPVEIEKARFVELTHLYGITFAFTPDVILMGTRGPMKGKYFVVDFKHTGQYWPDHKIRMFLQVPKYIAYLREYWEEYKNMRHGALIQINTRKDNRGEAFKFKWLPDLTPETFKRVRYENEEAMKEVAQFALLPVADQDKLAVRTVNNTSCQFCPFSKDICPMQLAGHDITKTMRTNYVQNTYGYEESPDGVVISGGA
jgi:hypothetical protein